ncbi:hypothetical protein [Fischerella sp. JS2]|uniref:hypothetical protein n=1 Tax=Fischerella sp. JS2 TaxID=2597771 RepID=UPI0028F0A65F|nr:hypothetical protein [Fischerella sp. JS2]
MLYSYSSVISLHSTKNLELKRPKITGEDFIRWYREQSQTLTKWAEKKAEDVKKEEKWLL